MLAGTHTLRTTLSITVVARSITFTRAVPSAATAAAPIASVQAACIRAVSFAMTARMFSLLKKTPSSLRRRACSWPSSMWMRFGVL